MANKSKTSKGFQATIKSYLDKRAEGDSLFAKAYQKEGKSIELCCQYILNEVQKSGISGYEDDEIFNMAIHYYDEDEIEVGKKISARVVISSSSELKPKYKPKEVKEKKKAKAVIDNQFSMF